MKKTITTANTLIVVAGLCSAVCFAQSGGSGAGSGSSSGSATSTASGTASSSSGSATGSSATQSQSSGATATTTLDTSGSSARASGTAPGTVLSTSPTGSTLATPNMNTVSPSQSVTDPAGHSAIDRPGATITVPRSTNAPDASPLSGISKSEIPSTSSAPPPIAADGSVTAKQEPGAAAAKNTAPIVPAGAESLPADRKMTRSALGSSKDVGPAAPVKVSTPPPAAMRESTPSTSNDGQVWIPGHYSWTGDRWNWTFGTWERPPTPDATWVPGNYDGASQRWTPGYWSPGAGAPTGR